jgi:hypothetical protein
LNFVPFLTTVPELIDIMHFKVAPEPDVHPILVPSLQSPSEPLRFTELIKSMPELGAFVRANPYGDQSIDCTNRAAAHALNAALLKTWYGVTHWDIPEGYLSPHSGPGRLCAPSGRPTGRTQCGRCGLYSGAIPCAPE